MKLSTFNRLLLAGGSAVGLSFAFPSYDWPLLVWVAPALLICSALRAEKRLAALCGFLHGFLFVLVSVPWIYTVLREHGYMDRVTSVGVLVLIAAAWGALTGGVTWGVAFLSATSVARACLAAPFLWVTMEFARLHLPEIAFPWNLTGYPAAQNLALLQVAALTGILGLSLLVGAFNSAVAWACVARGTPARRRAAPAGVFAAVLLIVSIVGPRLVPRGLPKHTARLAQLNFPETPAYPADWMAVHAAELDELERMSLAPPRSAPPPEMIIWPEAPAPFMFLDLKFAERARRLARSAGVPFFVGVIEWKPVMDASGQAKLQPYNSAVMLDAEGRRSFSYDKIHLVPFGEYEPFPLIHRLVTSLSTEVGGFHNGTSYAVGEIPGGHHLGVFICYEAIFPNLVRRFAANGANLLINISNDGWFGRSAAPDQHLAMARVRAVENRRWLLRATNNGYTVSVDPYGRIAARIAPDIRAALDAPYEFRSDHTVYTRYGDWVAWLCVGASGTFLFIGWRSKQHKEHHPGASDIVRGKFKNDS